MALTENETKKIAKLRNQITDDEWDNLRSNDEYAREVIAKYLPDAIINKRGVVNNLQAMLNREAAELAILEG